MLLMRKQENSGQSDSGGFFVDPTFQLTATYRRQLTELSHAQYDATRQSNRQRADRLRSRLVDDTPLGSGVGRIVYQLPDRAYDDGQFTEYVLKLPLPDHNDRYGYERDGRVQNRAEAQLWNRHPSQYLVPVVAANQRGRWVIMPRGEPLQHTDNQFNEFATRVANTYNLTGAQGRDITTENAVLLNEQVRLCDYGLLI